LDERTKLDGRKLNRHERRKRRTRAKLKQAALEMVLEKGYDEVTIQDIVDQADLGRGTFYVHFQDKEEVVWSLISDALEESLAEGSRRHREGSYPPGYLGFLMTFEHAARNRELYRLMLGSKGSALLTKRAAQRLVEQIEGSIRAGLYSIGLDLPAEIQAQFVVGTMLHLMVWWLETPSPYGAKEMADMIYLLVQREQPTGGG
jgi:AcrR family transcriptional regulator